MSGHLKNGSPIITLLSSSATQGGISWLLAAKCSTMLASQLLCLSAIWCWAGSIQLIHQMFFAKHNDKGENDPTSKV